MKKKFIIALSALIVVAGLYMAHPFMKYHIAEGYFENGDYERAKTFFNSLKSFKDSDNYVIECDYQTALSYKENGAYEEAIDTFKLIEDYKDSLDQIKDSKYLKAKAYIEEQDYDSALTILKNLEGYKDVDGIIKECIYNKAQSLIEKEDYDSAVTYLIQIQDYKDVASEIKEVRYKNGQKAYSLGEFTKASTIFTDLQGYKDSDSLLNKSKKMKSYIGTWDTKYGFSQVVISGWQITKIFNIETKNSNQATFDFKLLEDGSIDTDYNVYKISSDGKTLVRYERDYFSGKLDSNGDVYTKSSQSTYVPSKRVPPRIGMSKAELEESSWGKPRDINKTTTSYGVKEQWCYSGYRYVYLENGVVTSIQE